MSTECQHAIPIIEVQFLVVLFIFSSLQYKAFYYYLILGSNSFYFIGKRYNVRDYYSSTVYYLIEFSDASFLLLLVLKVFMMLEKVNYFHWILHENFNVYVVDVYAAIIYISLCQQQMDCFSNSKGHAKRSNRSLIKN